MIHLDNTTSVYNDYTDDLILFLERGLSIPKSAISHDLQKYLPKSDFKRLTKAQLTETLSKYDVLVNDKKIRYGFYSETRFGDYSDMVVETFTRIIPKYEKYIQDCLEFPSRVFDIDNDNIDGELKDHLFSMTH